MKPDVLLGRAMPPFTLAELEERFTLHRYDLATDKPAFAATVADRVTAVAASGGGPGDAGFMDLFPKLKLISCFGVGVDGIDLAAAGARGVAVTNTPDVLTDCVADLGIGLVIATLRLMAKADRFVRRGDWLKGGLHLGTSLGGKRLGVVGLGRIGKAIARRAEACGMTIAYHNRNRAADVAYTYHASVRDLAAASDVLMVVTPGGPATHRLIDAAVLAALGPKGFLINVARGSVVDETALVAALRTGGIAGAGLDVFEDEPKVPAELMAMENVVLQPHQASATIETRTAMGRLMIDNLLAHFAGTPLLTRV
jgi:lactate dehydrogenase-like 2-hydroxyacid dehydrogenase